MVKHTKDTLRLALLALREKLSEQEQHRLSSAICVHAASLDLYAQTSSLAAYLSIRGEVNPMPLILRAAQEKKETSIPRIAGKAMHFHRWKPGEELAAGTFGTREPAEGEQVIPRLIFAPLLGYDSHGYRLGYGGGYYDRLQANPEYRHIPIIGLAYGWQRVKTLPSEPHDVRLLAAVTENGIEWFEKQ